MEGYPKRKLGDPTWSAARDDAYAQKERPGGEPYRLSPSGDSAPPKATANPAPAASGANYAFAKGFRRQAPTNYPPHKKSFLQNPSQNGARIFSPPLSRVAVFSPHKV